MTGERNNVLIAPSILTADFGRLHDDVAAVSPHVDWFHLDVMDGHYVPNISFGPDVVAAVRRATDRPLHVHLMVSEPRAWFERFVDAGAERLTFHPEVVDDVAGTVSEITALGAGAGLAVHPDLPVEQVVPHLADLAVVLVMTVRPGFGGQAFLHEAVPKIARARELVDAAGSAADVEVDGGVNLRTLPEVLRAGASLVVAGSAIFDGQDPPAAARRIRAAVEGREPGV